MARSRSAAREQYWREVLQRQRGSGQSVRRFCLEHEINQASFYNWRRKLGLRGSRPAKMRGNVRGSPGRTTQPAPFIPLNILALAGPGGVVEVVHPRGHVVRVPASFDVESLERLLNILDRASGHVR